MQSNQNAGKQIQNISKHYKYYKRLYIYLLLWKEVSSEVSVLK